jgi:hypothetical protein
VNREALQQLAVEEGVDLAVSSEADSVLYGPMLPILDDENSDLAESLETYLARWNNAKEDEQFSPLDSVFAGEDWE